MFTHLVFYCHSQRLQPVIPSQIQCPSAKTPISKNDEAKDQEKKKETMIMLWLWFLCCADSRFHTPKIPATRDSGVNVIIFFSSSFVLQFQRSTTKSQTPKNAEQKDSQWV